MIEKRIGEKIDLICSYQRKTLNRFFQFAKVLLIEKLFLAEFIAYYFKNSLSLYDISFHHNPV
jgi:hypothetical protein